MTEAVAEDDEESGVGFAEPAEPVAEPVVVTGRSRHAS